MAVGTLDTPPDRLPQAHVFWSDHVNWSGTDSVDGLPRKD